VIVLYSLALLVSAALLFLLEPMIGKFVLPLREMTPTSMSADTDGEFSLRVLAGQAG